MTLKQIYDRLNELSPFALQEPWDNSGLIVGDWHQEISTVVLSIDVDAALIGTLDEGTLLITHHPLIFGGIKALDFGGYPAVLLRPMIQKGIANIAMHTNFDQTHLNAWVAREVLGHPVAEQSGFIAYLDVDADFDDFAGKVRRAFALPHLKSVRHHDRLGRVALVTGSGASLLREIDADCLLTGDIKYHDAMEAAALGRSMIDIGHFESERYFPEVLAPHLKNFGLTVIISSSKNPFTYH